MNGEGRGRASAMHRAADQAEGFMEGGQVWVAVVAGALLLLLQFPGIGDLLEKTGLEDSKQFLAAVGAILLTSILLELRQLKRSVTPAISGRQHYPDPQEMYDALKEKAAEITDPEQQWIEVLGLTLYSAWPVLEFFLERPEVYNWTVRLATLSKDLSASRPWVPRTWPQESATTVTQVLDFRAGQGAEHQHKIEIYEYDFTPAVHGFRLGNGDVFVSTLLWRPEGRLGKHRFSYDYVPAHDISPGAVAVRTLFKNWFDCAVANSKAPTPVSAPSERAV